jgi:hypothetical protein
MAFDRREDSRPGAAGREADRGDSVNIILSVPLVWLTTSK